jgi:adenine deaminase
MNISNLIFTATGKMEADLLIHGGNVVNVFNGTVETLDILIIDGIIAATGKEIGKKTEAIQTIDATDLFLAPGFIDAHIHIESTMLIPSEFARAVLPHGTVAVVADPHEIANVMGTAGIRWMLEASENLPVECFFMAPSCVPATHLETSGAELSAFDLTPLYHHDRLKGLAEVMNFPGVINGMPDLMAKIEDAITRGLAVDGHAPGLGGTDLSAYVAAGIDSDHECTTLEEAREKLAQGMYLFLREGSTEHNLETLLPAVTPETVHRCCLVSDDRHPDDLMDMGHLDHSLRLCVRHGLNPVDAIRMVTINPATRFSLSGLGAVAPGYRANIVMLENLENFNVRKVYINGMEAASDGSALSEPALTSKGRVKRPDTPASFNVTGEIDFSIRATGPKINAIGIVEKQIVTKALNLPAPTKEGMLVADPEQDLVKIAVIERHRGTGNMSVGMVQGTGIREGAIAGSVAHDSHNIIVMGSDDRDMKLAVSTLLGNQGGFAVVANGRITADLPLPVAGLMSDLPFEKVRKQMDILLSAARETGCTLENPFMTMSFLALPVIPELKITDMGLVDVGKFDFTSLFTE